MVDTITTYLTFQSYSGDAFATTDTKPTQSVPNILAATGSGPAVWNPANVFTIANWSMDVEQTLNIGSQSSGAGAGKITFNPFSITRKVDSLSPILFAMACSGTPFHRVYLIERRTNTGKPAAAPVVAAWLFGLVAVKTVEWSRNPTSPMEVVTFEYGQLIQGFQTTKANGTAGPVLVRGWDRVRNVSTTTVPNSP